VYQALRQADREKADARPRRRAVLQSARAIAERGSRAASWLSYPTPRITRGVERSQGRADSFSSPPDASPPDAEARQLGYNFTSERLNSFTSMFQGAVGVPRDWDSNRRD